MKQNKRFETAYINFCAIFHTVMKLILIESTAPSQGLQSSKHKVSL